MKAPIATILTVSLCLNLVLIAGIKIDEDEIKKLRERLRKNRNLLELMNRVMMDVMKHEMPKDFDPTLLTDLEAYLIMRENDIA